MQEYRYQEFPLWNGAIPFSVESDAATQERFCKDEHDGIDRLTDVVNPSITFYPVSGKGPHPCVVVCPGGGYEILAWNHEGIDICSWLNTAGISAFLLKYRCPNRPEAARADASRAIRYIRANAEKFGIAPDKIGIMGFSAGGHLSAIVSAPAKAEPYPPADNLDAISCRPDFTLLIYPAYLCDKENPLNLKPEFKVDKNTPPTFLIQAENDGIQVENAIAWFVAAKRAGVKAEMHLFANGGHGYGILRQGNAIAEWPTFAARWIHELTGVK